MTDRSFRRRSRVTAAIAALGALACWSVPPVERATVSAWLFCTECTKDQLAQVVARGKNVVPYLKLAVRDGPSSAYDSIARRQAKEALARATRHRTRVDSLVIIATPDTASFFGNHVDAFRLMYRLRAAQALQRIDSASARALISEYCQADNTELSRHPEYRKAFKLVGPCP